MEPKITGIALYPLEYAVKPWGTIPSGLSIDSVSCGTKCETKYAVPIKHHLVCAPNKDGTFKHIFVTGEIRGKTDPSIEPYLLVSKSMDPEAAGVHGNFRIWWDWPNKNAFTTTDAEYEIALRLVKTFAGPGSSIVSVFDQGPFRVKILEAPEPIAPKPSK